jgi:seryl-tRNA synthetase
MAYLIDFVPGLRNLSNYEYLEISDPFYLQKELLDTKLKAIQDEREKLIAEQNELQILLEQVSQESAKLMAQREELEKLNQEYQQKIEQYNDYNARINTLANWLARSTPQQIANALSREEVSVELLVDALATLESKSAAEILQALALVNPQKAAEVIAKMGEKRSE